MSYARHLFIFLSSLAAVRVVVNIHRYYRTGRLQTVNHSTYYLLSFLLGNVYGAQTMTFRELLEIHQTMGKTEREKVKIHRPVNVQRTWLQRWLKHMQRSNLTSEITYVRRPRWPKCPSNRWRFRDRDCSREPLILAWPLWMHCLWWELGTIYNGLWS